MIVQIRAVSLLILCLLVSQYQCSLGYAKMINGCVEDAKYDENFGRDYYCGKVVSWPIQISDFYNQDNHRLALQRYQTLYRKYRSHNVTSPTEDCLGIAWNFFCATTLSYCESTSG